ncbi:MAG: YggT family protein [Hydrogenobaculum sp.]|nr:MAG: YggT family protein [Hydrogenobaculum sp.]PMP90007.1 MAG: YggT family protein [Hydrogenobaculum sp.]HEK25279.1 YggT family protein [Hydrogenobaculum sp.]
MIVRLIDAFIEVYIILIIVYSLGSWFPQFTENSFFDFLAKIIEPPLEVIRRVVPPVAGLDLSPAVLIFILVVLQHILR